MKRFAQWLVVLLAVRLALMAFIPVFEPSEARYAAISANMARTGDFVVPRFTHNNVYQSFDGKPPLVFQAGGVCLRALGTSAPVALQFGVRIFPFLSALALLAILFHAVRRFADADAAKIAVIVCLSCTAFYAASGIAMTDMSLAACVSGALLLYKCFASARGRAAYGYAAGVAALLGTGMIVKGPVALALFGLPVLLDACVNHSWKALFNVRWLVVAPIALAIAVPWFVLIERVNPGAVWYFFYNENFMRFISHDYGDKYGAGREAFRGVSLLWALVATLPWALWPLVRMRKSRVRAWWQAGGWRQFEVLAIFAMVAFWGLTSRVLIYYLFPVIPLFASALVLQGDRARLKRLSGPCCGLSLLVVAGTLIVGTFTSDRMQGAQRRFTPYQNCYAYEFYHGTLSRRQLAQAREWAARREIMRQEKGKREDTTR